MDKRTGNPWLYRYVVLVAVSSLVLIASGAIITSTELPAPDASVSSANVHFTTHLAFIDPNHIGIATAVGLLSLGLAAWLSLAERRGWLALLGWAALIALGLDSWTAWPMLFALPASLAVIHACFAPVFFASIVAIAVFTSPGWREEPEFVSDGGSSLLRYMALAGPPLVVTQIVAGAAYRHKIMGVMPHMATAMVVSLVTLVVSVVIMQRYPGHRALRGAAIGLMSIVLVQVALGVTAFTLELLDTQNALALVFTTVAHVVVGALTLAASLVLAIQVQRNMIHT